MSAITVKAGTREPLRILGMPMTMLCESSETGGAWSLFEEEVPLGVGPSPHRHDWDEAYYILDGEIESRRFQLPSAQHGSRLQRRVGRGRKGADLRGACARVGILPRVE